MKNVTKSHNTMKKIVLIIVMSVLQTMVLAQIPYPPSTDTLPCGERQRDYFYSEWYDTSNFYLHPDDYNYTSPECPYIPVGLGRVVGDGTIRCLQQFAPPTYPNQRAVGDGESTWL